MKIKLISFLFISLIVALAGCSKRNNPVSSNNGGGSLGNIGGLGGGANGNINIVISLAQDNQGVLWFGANPSVTITISTIVITQAQLGINDTWTNPNPNQQFTPLEQNNFYTFYQVPQGTQNGQQWSFRFTGTIVQGNQSFDKTVNFSIQGMQ